MRQTQAFLYIILSLSNLPLLEGRLGRAIEDSFYGRLSGIEATKQEGLRGSGARKNFRTLAVFEDDDALPLVAYGGDPPSDVLPLKECEGDCDEDSDCYGDLVCFQRDGGDAIPGCLAGEEVQSRTDYCVKPEGSDNEEVVPTSTPTTTTPPTTKPTDSSTTQQPSPAPTTVQPSLPTWGSSYTFNTTATITIVGNNNNIERPLQLCEGDCDEDSDCAEGLVCYQREPDQPVPGCEGDDGSRSDYCIAPVSGTGPSPMQTSMPAGTVTANPSESTQFPTKQPTAANLTAAPTVASTGSPTTSTTGPPATTSPTESATTLNPTVVPESVSTMSPTEAPTTLDPTDEATTLSPTETPTAEQPVVATGSPTESAITGSPTELPVTPSPSVTLSPTQASESATESPTTATTVSLTGSPTTLGPVNDACPLATRLTFGDTTEGSTKLATLVEGAPNCGTAFGYGVWYRFRAAGAPLGIQVQANFPARMTILAGPHCNNLTCIEQINGFQTGDNSISYLWDAQDGERHYVVIDGAGTGDFNITVDEFPTSPNTETSPPTSAPSTSAETGSPTDSPSISPETGSPTAAPSKSAETNSPTAAPSTSPETGSPTSKISPTAAPSTSPETGSPTSASNTSEETGSPTAALSASPETSSPTSAPSTDVSENVVIIGGHASISDLEVVGNNGNFAVYPLQNCQGDCDTNDDCAEGLICFQRRGDEEVPGCGPPDNNQSGFDFCMDPNATAIPSESSEALLEPTIAPTVSIGGSATLPEPTAVPATAAPSQPTSVLFIGGSATLSDPPVIGGSATLVIGGSATLEEPPTGGPIATMGPTNIQNGGSATAQWEPTMAPTNVCPRDIQECPDGSIVVRDPQNDCEFFPCPDPVACPTDFFTCPDGSTVERVPPSCKFEVCQDTGICAIDTQMCPDGSYVGRDALNDCEFFSCAPSSEQTTMAPSMESTTMAPTTMALTPSKEPSSVAPATPKILRLVSNNDAAATKLAECQGDCDSDTDCGEGLRCFQRNHREAVPGCVGGGIYGADYCMKDTDQ